MAAAAGAVSPIPGAGGGGGFTRPSTTGGSGVRVGSPRPPFTFVLTAAVGWTARSCRPGAGGSPNPSMAISSQCPLTPRTPGQPVGLEMAWWGLFRAVENLLER